MARELPHIAHEEDPTRPTTSAENSARAHQPFPKAIDALGLNYQGGGERPISRISTPSFPTNFVYGSETESTVSSRGVYTFPVAAASARSSAGIRARTWPIARSVPTTSTTQAGPHSPDKEFAAQDHWSFVGGIRLDWL